MRRLVALGLLAVLAACSESASSSTVTVLAATSLTDAFTEIAAAFEAEHEGVDVALTFDGSARLATSIVEGAPADVFASADQVNLDKVAAVGLADGSQLVFATNRLQIVVARGNPLGVTGLGDLDGDVVLSLCAIVVPCGAYAAAAFERAGLSVPAAGAEQNVRGVLSRVQLGEADAGIVYVTDVLAADGVEGVDLRPDEAVEVSYPAAVLAGAADRKTAAAFVEFLISATAQAVLADHGFGPP